MSPEISLAPITPDESKRLIELETIIEAGRLTFFQVGNALAQIMEERLYRAKGFGSFAEYCETVWGFKKTYAYQLVQSAELVKELPAPLSAIAEKFNPGQVRALISVPKEQRETVINVAVTTAKAAGRKITAKDITTAAAPEPITTVVVEDVEAQPEPNFKRKFVSGTYSQKGAERWWFSIAKPEKRGSFFEFLLSLKRPVQVEDKEAFTKRVMRWLAEDVSETKGCQ